MFAPSRIVCLTEETVETLYLLGEQDRIVGISGYVVRPPQARREKPRVSAFTSANIDKILALQPDLVLTFSDLQAGIAADLIRHRIEVHAFNQGTVAGILDMIRMVGAMARASAPNRHYRIILEHALTLRLQSLTRIVTFGYHLIQTNLRDRLTFGCSSCEGEPTSAQWILELLSFRRRTPRDGWYAA